MRLFAIVFFALLFPNSAQAHWGHLGEVAGHGHWVALGAGVAAAAIAAWLGKEKMKADNEDNTEEVNADGDGETSGEPAGAKA